MRCWEYGIGHDSVGYLRGETPRGWLYVTMSGPRQGVRLQTKGARPVFRHMDNAELKQVIELLRS